jgi:hypothetical protein
VSSVMLVPVMPRQNAPESAHSEPVCNHVQFSARPKPLPRQPRSSNDGHVRCQVVRRGADQGTMQVPSNKKPKLSNSEIEAAKVRAADEARQKVWDTKTKKSMSGICVGC